MMADEPRAQWNTRIGFVLAAMGSAIGFGSIARFPMNAANNGGAAFILLYAVIMLLVGVPMMISEFSLGRTAQSNTVGTFQKLTGNPKTGWRAAGMFYWILAAFFLSWYAVIAGWVFRYVFASATGAYFDDPGAYFASAQEGPQALFWMAAVMGFTLLAMLSVISKGIERLNLVMMPALFVIVVGLVIYAATLDNVAAGYEFYLKPQWNAVTLGVVTAAVGQAFFSLSLGQGAMMTYASYLPKSASLARNSLMISISTLTFAFISGLLIFPLLSSFNLLDTGQAGLGLIFGPLTQAFSSMGSPLGNIVGTLFFLGTFFAGFTSAVSLVEPAISYVTEAHKVSRKRAAVLICLAIYTAGIAVAFSVKLLDFEGGVLTDVAVIIGVLLIALYVGWFSPKAKARARLDSGDEGPRLGWYVYPLVRYVMPVVLSVLLFFALMGTPCFLSGGGASEGLVELVFGADILGCAG
jgi:neurotransmitter:Na+ symporter, NSS family